MNVLWLTPEGTEERRAEDIPALLERAGGFVWVDVEDCNAAALDDLRARFGFHPLALADCQAEVPVPKIHVYRDHFFVVVHGLEAAPGRSPLVELDLFVGYRYLVTVHGDLADDGQREASQRETRAVRERMLAGRFRPASPGELGHAVVSALARRLEADVAAVARETAALEQRVLAGLTRNPEQLVEELFDVRHRLQTVRTIAAQSAEVFARMASVSRGLPEELTVWTEDLVDHFSRVRNVCDGEKELLQEVLDLYQTRIANELNVFVRRLTSVGAILVFATLIAGIYGMNFEHMPELGWQYGYPMALGLMGVSGLALAWWFRRRGWL